MGRGKQEDVHSDFAMDRKLGIRTTGTLEWTEDRPDYNRFESSPYRALDDLFEVYKPNHRSHVVDFGCGLGRVIFYFHYRFRCRGTGVELNADHFPGLTENLLRYTEKRKKGELPLRFVHAAAETCPIPDDSNIFFFFNPFSHRIFDEVMKNIIDSVVEYPRTIDIILYYPLEGFREIMRNWSEFTLLDQVFLDWGTDKYDKFMIYRFTPDDSLY